VILRKKRKKRKKGPRLRKIGILREEARESFHQWVRWRPVPGFPEPTPTENTCITCKRRTHVSKLDAGHYIHGAYYMSSFAEENVWPQCAGCNLFLAGNHVPYRHFLESVYGVGIDEILQEKRYQGWKPTREELVAIKADYDARNAARWPAPPDITKVSPE